MGSAGVGQNTGYANDHGGDQKDETDNDKHEAPPTHLASRSQR
jgi:hypothetical protein